MTTAARDIADFYINIRDSKGIIKYEQTLSYDTRRLEIKENDIPPLTNDGPYQLCVMPKSSADIINGWFPSQCPNLPINFDKIKNVYNEHYKSTFTILSTDKRIKVSTGHATVQRKYSIPLTLLITTLILLYSQHF